MRLNAAAIVLPMLAALGGGAWAAGCTGLSSDCELNLKCLTGQDQDAGDVGTGNQDQDAGDAGTGNTDSCDGAAFPLSCASCLKASCCQELAACESDGACLSCVRGVWPSPPDCSAPPTAAHLESLARCMQTSCSPACRLEADECNPVTMDGCEPDSAGCEIAYPGTFRCRSPEASNPSDICEPCDIYGGPFCGPGLGCYAQSGTCAQYCCKDSECGLGGKCEQDPVVAFGAPLFNAGDKVGLCVTAGSGAQPICGMLLGTPPDGACVTGAPPN